MLETIFACYLGCSIYYFVKDIKKRIKEKTIENDIDKRWLQLKNDCRLFGKQFKK
jgi:hypothetical protein